MDLTELGLILLLRHNLCFKPLFKGFQPRVELSKRIRINDVRASTVRSGGSKELID